MAVRPCRSADLPSLHRLFNAMVEPLGHGFAATEEEFCTAFHADPAYLRGGVTLVAEQAGTPVAFARAGIYARLPDRYSLAQDGDGLIFGPLFQPGHLGEAAALQAALLGYLGERRARRLLAFDPVESVGVPFYNGGWGGLSERLPHIVGLYARAGFRVSGREFCLTRPASPPPAALEPPPPLRLLVQPLGKGRQAVKLYDGPRQAGDCHYCRMFPTRSGHAEADGWGYVDGLGVEEDYRGRGLGRLLMAHALTRMQAMGCGPICLTTGAENYRAQNLYYSLGFALVDSCITLVREQG